jgi:hypothetical protein
MGVEQEPEEGCSRSVAPDHEGRGYWVVVENSLHHGLTQKSYESNSKTQKQPTRKSSQAHCKTIPVRFGAIYGQLEENRIVKQVFLGRKKRGDSREVGTLCGSPDSAPLSPTRSASGDSPSIPINNLRSPRHSFTLKPSTDFSFVNSVLFETLTCSDFLYQS